MSDFIDTHTHRDGLSTEIAAAEKAGIASESMKARILWRLSWCIGGLTPDEFCEEENALINTVRRRFTDLWKEGKIRHHPDKLTRQNEHNNPCVVWVLGEDKDRKPSAIATLKSENIRLRKMLQALGVNPDQTDWLSQ